MVNIKSSVGIPTSVVGDVLSLAGHAQAYVVTAGVTLGTTGVAVSVSLRLQVGAANAAAVDVRGQLYRQPGLPLRRLPPCRAAADDGHGGSVAQAEGQRSIQADGLRVRYPVGRKLVRPEPAVLIAG